MTTPIAIHRRCSTISTGPPYHRSRCSSLLDRDAPRSCTPAAGGPPHDAGRAIRLWRRRIGLTQEGLAEALSVTFSTVNRWENGHVQPSRLAWRAMAQLAAERSCPLDEPDDRGAATTGADHAPARR